MMSKITTPHQAEIYGVTGRKGHGKDTFSQKVVNQAATTSQPFVITHFADELKYKAMRIFGLTETQVFDPSQKEVPLNSPISLDLFISDMKKETGLLKIVAANKIANTPREVLQFFGTEYIRAAQDDYWIQLVLESTYDRMLISDLRFPNEGEAIRKAGGRIIKIVRIDIEEEGDAHSSETSIDLIDPDLLIGVKTGDLSIVDKVANLISLGKFLATGKYDYRNYQSALSEFRNGINLEVSSKLMPGTADIFTELREYYSESEKA